MHSRGCHLDRLRPARVRASPRKLRLNNVPVHTLRVPNIHPNSPLRGPVLYRRRLIHPLPYPTNHFRNALHPLHHPMIHPAPGTLIFPVRIAGRFVPSLINDQRYIHLAPQNRPRLRPSHITSVALPRSYPIMALRRVPLRRRQISPPYPSLQPPSLARVLSLKRCPPSSISPPTTLGGTVSTSERISTVNRWILSILPWDGFDVLGGCHPKLEHIVLPMLRSVF